MIKKGDRVLYALTAEQAEQVNRRRTTGGSIAQRMNPANESLINAEGRWPAGAQAHIGNAVHDGQTFPGIVVNIMAGVGEKVNLQVWLDGNDTLWVTSAAEGDGSGQYRRQH